MIGIAAAGTAAIMVEIGKSQTKISRPAPMNSMGKAIGTRMKSIEAAMKRVLKRIASTEERR